MKKIISIILSLAMIFSLAMQVSADDSPTTADNGIFTDTVGTWAESSINRWSSYKIIEGYDGKFNPDDTLTRAEMATVLCRLLNLTETATDVFADVSESDWFAPYVNRCYAAGIMLGSDGYALPDDPITREQSMVMLCRALGIKPLAKADLSFYEDAAEISDWAYGYVAAMVNAGIINGTTPVTVSPQDSIDRAATVTILDRAIGDYINTDKARVTASNKGIILIAADYVKVTGATVGTTIVTGPNVTGASVNGKSIAAGMTATAQEQEKKPFIYIPDTTPTYSDLTVSEANAVISGGTYNNVTIAASVGDGDVTLENVTILGQLTVEGGGSNSIHIKGCKLNLIQAAKENSDTVEIPRIELENTPVASIIATKPVIIEAIDKSSEVEKVEAKSDVTVKGIDTKVNAVVVPKEAEDDVAIKVIAAELEKLETAKPVSVETEGIAASIKRLVAQHDVTVKGDETKIETIEIPKTVAVTPKIDVQNGTVNEVRADAAVTIESSETTNGTIANVTANAAVTVDSAVVTKVTVTVEVTVTVSGKDKIEVAVETVKPVEITTTEATTNVSVSTTLTTDVSVTVGKEGEEKTAVTHIHKWEKGTQDDDYTKPTCQTEGKQIYRCTADGCTEPTKTETLPKTDHTYGKWTEEIPSVRTEDGKKGHYTCSECQNNFDYEHESIEDLVIPASYQTAKSIEDILSIFQNEKLVGAVLDTDMKIPSGGEIPAGKELVILKGVTATVEGTLNVYGTLTNEGEILDMMFIDVLGGTVNNSGTITGNSSGDGYDSNLALENGAVLKNTGTINDYVAVADYFRDGKVIGCQYDADAKYDRMAAVFGTSQLDAALKSDKYSIVIVSGTDAENVNTVELGGVTVPTGKTLMLKDQVFDGVNTYRNAFEVGTGNLTVEKDAYVICRNASVTVKAGAEVNAYSFVRFASLTVGGHVYTETGGMEVTDELTIEKGGILEIGSESGLFYPDKESVNEGQLIQTIRYLNGSVKKSVEDGGNIWKQSQFDGIEPNVIVNTLVITEDVVWNGDFTADYIIPVSGSLTVVNGTIKYKQILSGSDYQASVLGKRSSEVDENGYFSLTTNYKTVTSYGEFIQALNNNDVTGIIINADVAIPTDKNEWTTLAIEKPVIVTAEHTFTVEAYNGNEKKPGVVFHDVVLRNGGSLILESGATLTTQQYRSGVEEMFYRYAGRICVNVGGMLNVADGTVTEGSFINYTYADNCTDSNTLIFGENKPETEFSVHNEAQLAAAMRDDKCTAGVILETELTLENDLTVTKYLLINEEFTLNVPTGVTLTIAEGGELQNFGTVNIYGTLDNQGEIANYKLIDVFGGKLTNSGRIFGCFDGMDENGNVTYSSNIGIENGAVVINKQSENPDISIEISDCVVIADYYKDGKVTESRAEGTIETVEYAAVAFGTSQLDAALKSEKYNYVIVTGTTPCDEDNQTINTVELGGVTVPEGKTLIPKEEVFDGVNLYRNRYQISTGKTFTLSENSVFVCRGNSELAIDGTIADNGAVYIDFGGFKVIGSGFVSSIAELTAALEKGGTYHILPFSDTEAVRTPEYSAVLLEKALTATKNTELICHSGDIFYIPGLTVNEGVTLTTESMSVVLAADSTINGTLELRNGSNITIRTPDEAAENETTTLTVSENGKMTVGDNCFVDANSERWEIVNDGTIEGVNVRREDGHFSGKSPIEYATRRDVIVSLYQRFGQYHTMTDVDYTANEDGLIPDLGCVYAYPDGGSQMYNEENPNDSDFEALGAFAWFIKNGVIPAYDETTNLALNPYKTVTESQIAAILTALGKKVTGNADVTYTELSGDDFVSRTDYVVREDNGNEYRTSDLNELINRFQEVADKYMPLETVEKAMSYSFSRTMDNEGNWVENIEGMEGNTLKNLHFADTVTINCSTAIDGDNNWGGEIRFENCKFDGGITVYYSDKCNFNVNFDNSCTFGENAIVRVVKGDDAELFRDVRVEIRGLPTGAKVEAEAPAEVKDCNGEFILNNLPIVGSAGVDFDCMTDHSEGNYDEIDHKNCTDGYCMRLEIFEGSSMTIAKDTLVATKVSRLNNNGTITVDGTLSVNELNNHCYWDNDNSNGRTPHYVIGSVTVNEGGVLNIAGNLNNEKQWEGEGDAARKIAAIYSNKGTVNLPQQ